MLTVVWVPRREGEASCTEAVRLALSAAERPLTLTCLRLTLGNRWPSHRISSALAKLRESGEIEVLPPMEAGRCRGQRYVARACRLRRVSPPMAERPPWMALQAVFARV